MQSIIPGAGTLEVPASAKLARIAGELQHTWLDDAGALRAAIKLQAAVGKAGGGPGADALFRQGTATVLKRIANSRKSAIGLQLALHEGDWFEARGYSRVSTWKRYTRRGNELITTEVQP
jgi:hypothetical protein